jgi:iron complex outermembrane receptor protein
VVGFSKRASDLIQLRQASATASKAFNVGEADLAGLELRGRLNVGRWLDLTANYTFQRAVDAGAAPHARGRSLPRRPDHELFVRPRLRLLPDRLTVTPRLSYTSRTFLDAANLQSTPSRLFIGLELDLALGAGLSLGITAENLLDQRTQDFQGYPLPGRSVFASLQWRWVQGP